MSAADRQLNRELKKRLDASSTDDKSCSKFTLRELTSAINKMKRKGAAGPDNIPPTFLKALGPIALQNCLQYLTNHSDTLTVHVYGALLLSSLS